MSQDWKVAAKQQFLNNRDPGKLVEIPVPEWGISIFYWPHVSSAEKKAIGVAYDGGKDIHSAHIENLLARARDQNGRLLFAERERDDLFNKYDPEVIEKISTSMLTETAPAEESVSKNS